MNIIIIGHPGSGKTYVADHLSKMTNTLKIDIDVLFDKHPFYLFYKKSYNKALAKLLEDNHSWVIDGYHVGMMPDELFIKADYIIFLNLPKDELKQNVLARYKLKKANKEFSHWQSMYLNNLKNFGQIRFQDYAIKNDVARVKNLATITAAYTELRSKDEINLFISNFHTTP